MSRMTAMVLCAVSSVLAGCGGTYGGGGLPPGALFQNAVAFPLGAEHAPDSVVVADFNRDGRDDVAVANRVAGSVSVSLGFGDGVLSAPVDFALGPVGGGRNVMVAGDFDRDGILDLAVATADAVVLLRGAGVGTYAFGPLSGDFTVVGTVPLVPSAGPSGIVAGDFDHDGDLDLAVAAEATDDVRVALGAGDGTFGAPTSFPLGATFHPTDLAVGNLDDDVYLDLAASTSAGTVMVMRGTGAGGFGTPLPAPVAAAEDLSALALGDLDRDGDLEIVVANRSDERLHVLLGNGDATFAAPVPYDLGPGPTAVVLQDFDRDGALDAAVTIDGIVGGDGLPATPSGAVLVLLGNGNGTFDPALTFPTQGDGTAAIATGDLDRNGSLDLVVANEDSDSFSTLLGAPHVRYTYLSYYQLVTTTYGPVALATADLDVDGHPDLLTVDRYVDHLDVTLGVGDGTFAPAVTTYMPYGTRAVGMVAADFDWDAAVDVAVLGATNVVLLRGNQTASFTVWSTIPLPPNTTPTRLALADLDRDGELDLVVTAINPSRVLVAFGLPALVFEPFTVIPVFGVAPQDVAIGDYDRDGDLDLAVSGSPQSFGNVRILLGDGHGAFVPGSTFTLGFGNFVEVPRIVTFDVDRDGALDLVGSWRFNGLGTMLGNKDGTFHAGPSTSTGHDYGVLVPADVERDGDLDVVAGIPYWGAAVQLVNYGGTFVESISYTYSSGGGRTEVVVGDWNGDGLLDLAKIDEFGNGIAVFRAY